MHKCLKSLLSIDSGNLHLHKNVYTPTCMHVCYCLEKHGPVWICVKDFSPVVKVQYLSLKRVQRTWLIDGELTRWKCTVCLKQDKVLVCVWSDMPASKDFWCWLHLNVSLTLFASERISMCECSLIVESWLTDCTNNKALCTSLLFKQQLMFFISVEIQS